MVSTFFETFFDFMSEEGHGVLEAFKETVDLTGLSISKVLGGLKFTTVAAGIGLAVTAVQAYHRHQEQIIQNAQQSAQAYRDGLSSIEDYSQEANSLIEAIDSETLSSNELYEARLRLAEIQQSISSDFGSTAVAAAEMNLLTANTEKASAAFESLASAQAQQYYTQNTSDIETAFEKVYSKQTHDAATMRWSSASDVIKGRIEEIVNSYEGASLKIDKMSGSSLEKATIQFKGTAEEYKDFLASIGADFDQLKSDLQFDGVNLDNLIYTTLGSATSFSGSFEREINDVSKILDNYSSQAAEGLDALIKTTPEYSSTLKELTAAEEAYTAAMSHSYDTEEERAAAMEQAYNKLKDATFNYWTNAGLIQNEGVRSYFGEMATDLDEKKQQLKLEVDISSAINGKAVDDTAAALMGGVRDSLEAFSSDGEVFASDILNFSLDKDSWNVDDLNAQQKAYLALEAIANHYNTTVQGLLI